MNKKIDTIQKAEQVLSLIRPQVEDCADFSACRNIIELSRKEIQKLIVTKGYTWTLKNKNSFIQQALYLSDLLNPESSQIIPSQDSYSLDLWHFLNSPYQDLTIDPKTIHRIESEIDFTVQSVFEYLNDSFSNLDAILKSPKSKSNLLTTRFDSKAFLEVQNAENISDLSVCLSHLLNVSSPNRMFSQLFELNRILFKFDLYSSDLNTYVNKQDMLYSAFTGFQLSEDFDLIPSPTSPLTTVTRSTLELAISNPELANYIIEKTYDFVASHWLTFGIDWLAESYTETVVRSIVSVSGVYSQMDFASKLNFESNFEDARLFSFIKNAVELGTKGDVNRASSIVDEVYAQKYQELILEFAQALPYELNQLLHELIQFKDQDLAMPEQQLQQIVNYYKALPKHLQQLHQEVIRLINTSQIFRAVVLDCFPYNIAIH